MRDQLRDAIFENSIEKKDILVAAKEWDIVKHYKERESKCVCGQTPITYCSIIENRYTGEKLDPIGNECIYHFENEDMSDDLKTLQKRDKTIRGGKYSGMTFEELATNHPHYQPSVWEMDRYATCREYLEYRYTRLRDLKDPICVCCKRPHIGEFSQCLSCYRKNGRWTKVGSQWGIKVGKDLYQSGDVVPVVNSKGEIHTKRLGILISTTEWDETWYVC
jgi:hypothetical protein